MKWHSTKVVRAERRRSNTPFVASLLAFVLGCASAFVQPAEVTPTAFYEIVTAQSLDAQFLSEAEVARRSIPEPIWQRIAGAGWQVRLAEFVVDAAPFLKDVRPRGWPRNYTWNHTDAVHFPKTRIVVLAEKRRRPSGEVVRADRVAGVLRHELGHAFDMVSGWPYRFRSARADFAAAYRDDCAALTDQQRQDLGYYLQSGLSGPQETFAEAFAITFGGGSDVTKRDQFTRAFPAALACVQQIAADFSRAQPQPP